MNKVQKVKHLHQLADHRPVMTQINIEEVKFRGDFYWKMINFYLNDQYYQKEINELFENYNDRKSNLKLIEYWEILTQEIQKTSKSYSNFKSKERELQKDIINQLKGKNLDLPIQQINKEIETNLKKNFVMSGNRVRAKNSIINKVYEEGRAKNSIINKVYEEGREINRKQEIKKGNKKFIFQIQN